nr:MAG TPA: hypothetical protein [Caudoviricetes sp.]
MLSVLICVCVRNHHINNSSFIPPLWFYFIS